MESAALERRQKLLALRRQATGKDEQDKDSLDETPTVEHEATAIERDLKRKADQVATADVDVYALAPRKVDWDLKRDVEPSLAILERRTQHKLVELLRLRLSKDEQQIQAAMMARIETDVQDE